MLKRILFILIFTIISSQVFAQEVFFKKDKYSSELYLKLPTTDIRNVEKRTNEAVVYFTKQIRAPFSRNFDDNYIKSVSGSGDTVIVQIAPETSFSIVNDVEGIKIIATKERTNSEIFSSYGVGSPLLSEGNVADDTIAAAKLDEVDQLIINREFPAAVRVLEDLLRTTNNDFYRQEAMYKLGDTYLLMSEYDDTYLLNAYTTFDDFVRLYPNNFRVVDALIKSAESKELENQIFEAIYTYEKIYETAQDSESRRRALIKSADLYKLVGQQDKAIDVYKKYLQNFRTNADRVSIEIGKIYFDKNDIDLAYEYFYQIDVDNLVADETVDADMLLAIAKTFDNKNRTEDAIKIYNEIFDRVPDTDMASASVMRAAELLQQLNKTTEADKLLLQLKENYPDKLSGQQASIEYAKKYLSSKPSDYWKEFFADLLARDDDYGQHPEAKYLIIKSLVRENKVDEVIDEIKLFTQTYPDSPHFVELDSTREEFLFAKGTKLFNANTFAEAEPVLLYFQGEYGDSKYKNRVDKMLIDIRFDKAEKMYANNNFKDVIVDAEKYIADNPNAIDIIRWFELYENASYKEIGVFYGAKDYPATRVKAREYLSVFPSGRYVTQVSDMLEGALKTPMEDFEMDRDYPATVLLYDANKEWLASWKNEPYKDDIELMAATALYRTGLASQSKTLYDVVTPRDTTPYISLGILLGDTKQDTNINKLSASEFEYVINELSVTNLDRALSLLKAYSANPKLATQLEYKIAKNTVDDAKRQEILFDVYEILRANDAAKFDGSDEVFLDVGLQLYRKNDFQGAIEPLNSFVLQHSALDEKRAEALYYLGKSFVMMNDKQRGYQYYNELINTMPTSIYAGIAKSELDEDAWRNGLNN